MSVQAGSLLLKDIHLTYALHGQPLNILNGINLSFKSGEMVAILGPSGSGKSTLLYILGCMLRPTSGTYLVDGRDISHMEDEELAELRNRHFGFVFQQFHLLPRADMLQNLLLGSRYNRTDTRTPEEVTAKAKLLLEQVGLTAQIKHVPNQMSGGQQQRAAIARALMNDPSVILADEPTGNLDSKSTEQVLSLLRDINKQGRTVIIITHDQEVAKRCDRIITVRDGQTTDSAPVSTPTPIMDAPKLRAKTKSQFFKLSPSWREDAQTAWQNLLRNKSRSVLTMLGVTIGVSAVLSTITLGSYTRDKILQTYESLGVNKLVIRAYPRWFISAKDITGAKFEGVSTENDIRPMRRLFPEIQLISPVSTDYVKSIDYGGKTLDQARVLGVNEEYFTITNRKFLLGKAFSEFHVQNRSRVCVIGFEIAQKLFGKSSPLNHILQISNGSSTYTCQVVGVLASQTSNNEWFNPNQQVLLPETFLGVVTNRWNSKPFEFNIQVAQGSSIDDLTQKVKAFFNLKYGRSVEVRVDSDELLVSQMKKFLNLFTILLTGVALISLAVGGIGITNMMLVSVAERFKEIGLRKALGARTEEIRSQFLIESTILCAIAGSVGIAIGVLGYHLALFMASKLFPQVQFEWVFNFTAITLSFVCIVTVGLLSGLVPAVRAQKLEIVEALRSE